jgi:2-succinyl-5-enolpyruvyl-6-hydroxy-3-cyclohexene-1-carboxylate synthase
VRGLNRNTAWAAALIDELVRAGVRHAVVSPGSRSAPLALALAAEPAIRDHAVLDERGGGYFALGLARAARAPVALVCTSGTAAANYLPAVVEAHYGRVPLIVLTADRPPELRDCDAGQAIEQVGLFGRFVRFERELPTPEPSSRLLRAARSIASRAAVEALGPPAGPVHLNVPLREPLDPTEVEADARALQALDPLALSGRPPSAFTRVHPAAPGRLEADELAELAARLRDEPRGWLVVGPLDASPALAAGVARLAELLDWAVLAEPLSQLRCGPHDRSHLVEAGPALLRCESFVGAWAPRAVLRLGSMPTAKAYRLALERHAGIEQWIADPWGWSDPSALAAGLLRADPERLVADLVDALERRPPRRDDGRFARAWLEAGRRARHALDAALDQRSEPSEPALLRAAAEATPDDTTVFLANSLPVREADLYWCSSARRLRFVGNRGANGIDGTLACALGTAAGSGGPTLLISGDLALLHDASAWLLAARAPQLNLCAVVLDNDGGGIFELLPVARSAPREAFERHLAAPHGLDLVAALRGFGLRCTPVSEPKQLVERVGSALGRGGIEFVVARTDRRANAQLDAELAEAVLHAVGEG